MQIFNSNRGHNINCQVTKEHLLEELSKFDVGVLSLAYLYAKNEYAYGIDVTTKIMTAVQQSNAINKAYNKGFDDGCKYYFEKASEEE